jgi:hypothetical protein
VTHWVQPPPAPAAAPTAAAAPAPPPAAAPAGPAVVNEVASLLAELRTLEISI